MTPQASPTTRPTNAPTGAAYGANTDPKMIDAPTSRHGQSCVPAAAYIVKIGPEPSIAAIAPRIAPRPSDVPNTAENTRLGADGSEAATSGSTSEKSCAT